jgi:hypothetical protein
VFHVLKWFLDVWERIGWSLYSCTNDLSRLLYRGSVFLIKVVASKESWKAGEPMSGQEEGIRRGEWCGPQWVASKGKRGGGTVIDEGNVRYTGVTINQLKAELLHKLKDKMALNVTLSQVLRTEMAR